MIVNQNPGQIARDTIDAQLLASGWMVQSFKQKNIAAGVGVAIRKYPTDTGPADYILFVNKKVDKNFHYWIFKKQAGTTKYTTEQVQWLRMIKDYIANSFHVDRDDFKLDPFNKAGGLGKFYQLFKEDYETILDEMNESY